MSNFQQEHYDVIIVGTGPAGSTATYFLSEIFSRITHSLINKTNQPMRNDLEGQFQRHLLITW